MKMLGAQVVAVEHGSATLKDAINEALRDWVTNVETTHYLIGTVTGCTRSRRWSGTPQAHRRGGSGAVADLTGGLPDAVIACVGAARTRWASSTRSSPTRVRLIGVEAGGEGLDCRHAARFASACPVLHGAMSYLMQDDDGQTVESHSISAGLDYPSVGPEHSFLRDSGRAEYRYATDADVMTAFELLCRTEGIIPALESAHALAGAIEVGRELAAEAGGEWDDADRPILLVNLSGRGDKDMHTAAAYFGLLPKDKEQALEDLEEDEL